jgi:DNA modification methylase
MINNSSPGQAVYDPFLGSGTTLIAAETIGRVCVGVELDPRYVDLALRRWETFSGHEVTLLGDGRTLSQITQYRSDEDVGAGEGL